MLSQGVDTTLVVIVLFVGVESWSTMSGYILDGWLFKVICAALDTVVFYGIMAWARRYFRLKVGEEIKL